MAEQGSLFSIIYQSGWLSMLVLLVLLLMSVISWAVILRKWVYIGSLARKSRAFLKGVDIQNGLQDLVLRSEQFPDTYLTRLFHSAYRTFSSIANPARKTINENDRSVFLQSVERSIEKAIIDEKTALDRELGLLATISSSAPFIGLLGTVTGIIDAFYSIAAQGASSIAVVAPGISAALVATAVGLFTAIPALIGYNVFREKTRALSNEMNGFGLDILSLLVSSLDETPAEGSGQFPEIRLGKKRR